MAEIELQGETVTEIKKKIIKAGYKAVNQLIKVAEEDLFGDDDDDISPDKLKNAAASKKMAIFDALEILDRIEQEDNDIKLEEGRQELRTDSNKGFAEQFAKKTS
jgi:hypothetical protein